MEQQIDGNDALFGAISDAADKLVDLIRLAESRGAESTKLNADIAYAAVLNLRHHVAHDLKEKS